MNKTKNNQVDSSDASWVDKKQWEPTAKPLWWQQSVFKKRHTGGKEKKQVSVCIVTALLKGTVHWESSTLPLTKVSMELLVTFSKKKPHPGVSQKEWFHPIDACCNLRRKQASTQLDSATPTSPPHISRYLRSFLSLSQISCVLKWNSHSNNGTQHWFVLPGACQMGILITGNHVEKLIFAAANYEFEGPNICIKKKRWYNIRLCSRAICSESSVPSLVKLSKKGREKKKNLSKGRSCRKIHPEQLFLS